MTNLELLVQHKVSKNYRELGAFLTPLLREKGDKTANINGPDRIYFVDRENKAQREEFFTLLETCRMENRYVNYGERQAYGDSAETQYSGCMYDFDRYQSSPSRQVAEKQMLRLVDAIAVCYLESLDLPESTAFHIFCIRRPEVTAVERNKQAVYKDGWHLVIPEIMLQRGVKRFIIDKLAQRMDRVFQGVEQALEPMLDKNSASVPVMLFGSSKVSNPPKKAYPLVGTYRVTIQPNEEPRYQVSVETVTIDQSQYNMVYELSLGFAAAEFAGKPTLCNKRCYEHKLEHEVAIRGMVERRQGRVFDEEELMDTQNTIDLLAMNNAEANQLRKLLELLDQSFTTEYKKWFEVICAIAHTDPSFKPLAEWFSKRRPDMFSQAEFDRVWMEALNGRDRERPVTKRSILYWARESSPERYKEVMQCDYIQQLMELAIKQEGRLEHVAVANLLKMMISDKFICDYSNDGHYRWFEFVTAGQMMRDGEIYKWRMEPKPDNMHIYMGVHLPRVFDEVLLQIKDRREKVGADGDECAALLQFWKSLEKEFKNSKLKLGNNMFQNQTIDWAKYVFRRRGFFEKLDNYEDVIGVGNGVLKLGPKCQLLQGVHEYAISKYTPTEYIPYDPNNPYIRDIENAIDDIYPEPDVRKFIRYHKSLNLDRKPSQNMLFLRKGGGSNGKSTDEQLIENALGDAYFRKVRMQLFTEPPERAGAPNSAKMVLKGINGGYADETDIAPRLNTQSLKQLVNPGKIGSRDLNSKEERFDNFTNLSVLSNHEFIVETNDHGTWRRMKMYNHKVKFCENPDPKNPYEKKVRPEVLHKWPKQREYREAMLSIMVHYYEEFMRLYDGQLSKIPTPTINRETEQFRNRQDTVNRFITEMMVISPSAGDLAPSLVANKYAQWYNTTIGLSSNSLATIASQLESSRLDKHIEVRNNGKAIFKVIVGVRCKASVDDPLLDGEQSFSEVAESYEVISEDVTPRIVTQTDNVDKVDNVHYDLGEFITRPVIVPAVSDDL